jgi:hypothetical protein
MGTSCFNRRVDLKLRFSAQVGGNWRQLRTSSSNQPDQIEGTYPRLDANPIAYRAVSVRLRGIRLNGGDLIWKGLMEQIQTLTCITRHSRRNIHIISPTYCFFTILSTASVDTLSPSRENSAPAWKSKNERADRNDDERSPRCVDHSSEDFAGLWLASHIFATCSPANDDATARHCVFSKHFVDPHAFLWRISD